MKDRKLVHKVEAKERNIEHHLGEPHLKAKEHSLEEKTKALLLGGAEKSLPGTVCHWSGEITAAVCRLSEGCKQRR